MEKLKEMVSEASIEPKDRNMWVGIGEKSKEIRREEKRKRGDVKESRRSSNFRDFDD